MDFSTIVIKMAELLLIMCVGYLAFKTKVMDKDFNKKLTALVLCVTNPCLTVSAVIDTDSVFAASDIGKAFIFAMIGYALAFALSLLFVKLTRTSGSAKGVYECMLLFGNVGFMGFPVVRALYGAEAVFYASLFCIPFNIMAFTLGVVLVSGGGGVKLKLKDILSPTVIGSLLALVFALLNVRLPALITDTVTSIGSITTPAALLVIGSNIAATPLKGIAGTWRTWLMTAVKLLISPIILLLILRPFVQDPMILGVAVILQGMPVASICTMLAIQYGGDTECVGQGTFVSTVLSVITIPILTLLL